MRGYFLLCCTIALQLCIAGCSATGSDIVKVINTSSEKSTLTGLKDADRAMLEEIKRTSAGKDGSDTAMRGVITGKTRNLTVAEYLQLHPETDGKSSRDYIVGGNDVLSI